MSGKEVVCKTPADFRITTPSLNSWHDVPRETAELLWRKDASKKLDKQRHAFEKHCAELAKLPLEDPETQKNLLDQAISALQTYPEAKRRKSVPFTPFLYLVDPVGAGFYVADMEGSWDQNGHAFTLKSIVIQDFEPSFKGIQKIMGDIQHFNPSVPKLGSDWFNLIAARAERVELV